MDTYYTNYTAVPVADGEGVAGLVGTAGADTAELVETAGADTTGPFVLFGGGGAPVGVYVMMGTGSDTAVVAPGAGGTPTVISASPELS